MATHEIQQVVITLQHEECNATKNGDDQHKLADMEGSALEKITGFKAFTFEELQSATDNFSPSNMLGERCCGQVFQGLLGGKHVAVKRLLQNECVKEEDKEREKESLKEEDNEVFIREKESPKEEDKEVFIREIRHLAALNHQNILSLMGFCLDGPTPLLVTEKLHSLHKTLYESTNHLNWTTRFRIALGVAKGLEYLHMGANRPVLHCDIKQGNILLDLENLTRAYIADFGVVHLLPGNQSVDSGEELQVSWYYGTFGYMAPEAKPEKRLSTKSDVYSFGKLLYALLSGKENVHDMPACLIRKSKPSKGVGVLGRVLRCLQRYASHWCLNLLRNNMIEKTVDPDLLDEVLGSARAVIEVSTVLKLIVLCTQNNAEQRPSMDSVRVKLDSATSCKISWAVKFAISVGIKTCRWLSYLALAVSNAFMYFSFMGYFDWVGAVSPPLYFNVLYLLNIPINDAVGEMYWRIARLMY